MTPARVGRDPRHLGVGEDLAALLLDHLRERDTERVEAALRHPLRSQRVDEEDSRNHRRKISWIRANAGREHREVRFQARRLQMLIKQLLECPRLVLRQVAAWDLRRAQQRRDAG